MKSNILLLILIALFLTACGNAPTTVNTSNGSTQTTTASKDNSLVTSSHSGNMPTQTKPDSPSNTSTSSAPPMSGGQGQAIDTSLFDAEIAKADKDLKTSPNDNAKKKALAEAYAKRAFALTEVAQYKSALGDFRKSLKLDSTNKEAQTMHDQILEIYKSLNREPPKEGEEPPPLPFKKG